MKFYMDIDLTLKKYNFLRLKILSKYHLNENISVYRMLRIFYFSRHLYVHITINIIWYHQYKFSINDFFMS